MGTTNKTLKVIGAGYGRTGTLSTYTALNQLGLPCYHMFEVLQNKANKTHIDFWNKVANSPAGQQHDWSTVFANYSAVVDNPACSVWRELHAAYPEAKVLLTLHPRGPEAWYDSTMDTIYFTEVRWQFKVLAAVVPFMRKFGNMSRKLIWERAHKGSMRSKAKALKEYETHIEEVKAAIPADQLLIFTVDQGWGPLCDFLGLPVPNTPFPNVNDRKQIKGFIAAMTKGAYVILGVGVLLLALLAYGLVRLMRGEPSNSAYLPRSIRYPRHETSIMGRLCDRGHLARQRAVLQSARSGATARADRRADTWQRARAPVHGGDRMLGGPDGPLGPQRLAVPLVCGYTDPGGRRDEHFGIRAGAGPPALGQVQCGLCIPADRVHLLDGIRNAHQTEHYRACLSR
jgi:hypothetical protein